MDNKEIAFIVNQIFKASNDTNVDKLLEAFRNNLQELEDNKEVELLGDVGNLDCKNNNDDLEDIEHTKSIFLETGLVLENIKDI
jgi:hypothetical protein